MTNEKDISIIRSKKEAACDINTEITIEDYKTDIKRILCSEESLLPPSKYLSKNGLEMNGTLNGRILYLGTDDRLYTTSYAENYTVNCKPEAEIPGENLADLTCLFTEGITVRLLSPRKFSVKGKIRARTTLLSDAEKEECLTEKFIPSTCEALKKTMRSANVSCVGGDIIELCDEYISRGDTERIIGTDGKVFISDVICEEGKVSVRGELIADVLSCDDSGYEIPTVTRRKLQFSQEIDCHDAQKSSKASVVGICTEVKAVPEESRVLITAYCLCEATVVTPTEEAVCTDIFAPSRESTSKESKLKLASSSLASNGNISVSTSLPLASIEASPTQNALTAYASASTDELTLNTESGKAVLTGNCKFRIIFFDDTESPAEYDAKDVSIPFRYEIPTELKDSPKNVTANLSVSRVSVRTDGEKLGIDAELSIALCALAEDEETVISSVSVGETRESDENCIKVIYPAADDTLWSLAKNASVRINDMCAANGIKSEGSPECAASLSKIKYVII